MGIVVVIIAVLAIIGWAYNSVKSDQAKEKAGDMMRDAVESYCEFYKTSLAFGTTPRSADSMISYIINNNDVKLTALEGEVILLKDVVTTVEMNRSYYYGETTPCIILGNRNFVPSEAQKEHLKYEIKCYINPNDRKFREECGKIQKGDTVLLLGIVYLDFYTNRPTELRDVAILRRNGHMPQFLLEQFGDD